jgi:tetratricopeptide (TPR) repeat protein
LSEDVKDTQGIAFADMDLCQLNIRQGQFADARKRCDNAMQIFEVSGSRDLKKLTRSYLADIDLEEGQPARALTALNEVLTNDAMDIPAMRVAPIYKLRSRANAAVGNFRESHADLEEYMRRVTTADEARRIRQSATLRARFEMDRQLQRNAEATGGAQALDRDRDGNRRGRHPAAHLARVRNPPASPCAREACEHGQPHGSSQPAPHLRTGQGGDAPGA